MWCVLFLPFSLSFSLCAYVFMCAFKIECIMLMERVTPAHKINLIIRFADTNKHNKEWSRKNHEHNEGNQQKRNERYTHECVWLEVKGGKW